jgi:hypothetical protein
MGHVQEKQVTSCFADADCSPSSPIFSSSALPSPRFRISSAPSEVDRALSAGAPTRLRTLPSPSEPRAQTEPS